MLPDEPDEKEAVDGPPSTDRALRDAAALFADAVFALPDGGAGPRAARVGYERAQLVPPPHRRRDRPRRRGLTEPQ